MLTIGSAWQKMNAETGKYSISFAINEEILELYPALKNLYFGLYENKNKEEEKQPDFYIYAAKKEEK